MPAAAGVFTRIRRAVTACASCAIAGTLENTTMVMLGLPPALDHVTQHSFFGWPQPQRICIGAGLVVVPRALANSSAFFIPS